ncbi:hypothetical protein T12_13924 [Trichinella patagoniensis]|uniref:Uncharacterized protein n=1 Tax=Trichinella patagoniensis TaxID=990121 RepID=A0A0V1AFR7_9BILA|nr:hypothetical protein T12_13924 [Trichinella patagoniensis]
MHIIVIFEDFLCNTVTLQWAFAVKICLQSCFRAIFQSCFPKNSFSGPFFSYKTNQTQHFAYSCFLLGKSLGCTKLCHCFELVFHINTPQRILTN